MADKKQSKTVNFSEAEKQRIMEKNQEQLPNIRQIPEWKSTEMLEVLGIEWQAIATHFESINNAFMAFHSVINRNLVNGKMKMRFQKFNEQTGKYENMSEQEEQPYIDEFNKAITEANKIAADSIRKSNPEAAPRLDAIVDSNGVPYEDKEKGYDD